MHIKKFLKKLEQAIHSHKLEKLILSKPAKNNLQPSSLKSQPTKIKEKYLISTTIHQGKKDIIKNLEPQKLILLTKTYLEENHFLEANLITEEQTHNLKTSKKGKITIVSKINKPKENPKTQEKDNKDLLTAQLPFLTHLGITTEKGEVKPTMQAKYRQVKRFLQIVQKNYKNSSLSKKDKLSILDLGSGKGYLTFGVNHLFTNLENKEASIIGIDENKELTDLCNAVSTQINAKNMHFVASNIQKYTSENNISTDIVIALHACDTATDDSIKTAIEKNAKLIFLAPCCQHYVRQKINPPQEEKPLLKYGIHLERFASLLTDSLRALVLEYYGFKTDIIEFISPEHTSKNIRIIATKKSDQHKSQKLEEMKKLKEKYKLQDFYLDKLLKI